MPRPLKVLPDEQMRDFEKDFRAGIMPWAAIGKKYGVGSAWIKRQIVELGLTRDLRERIKVEAVRRDHEKIAKEALKEQRRDEFQADPERKITEREVTEANAELIATVTASHRALLARQRAIVGKIIEELEFASDSAPDLKALADELRKDKERRSDANGILALIDRSCRIDDLKKLSDATKTLITIERDVLRIGGTSEGGDDDGARVVMIPAKQPIPAD
jgi:hypothetical protein